MIGFEPLLQDADAALVQDLSFTIAALLLIKSRQVTQRRSNLPVFGPEHRLAQREAALIEHFGLGVAALRALKLGQAVQCVADTAIVGVLIANGEAAPKQRLGVGIAALVSVQIG